MTRSGRLPRKQRMDPVYQGLRDIIGRDPQGASIAAALARAGIDSPEKLRSLTYAEIHALPGLGVKARRRLSSIRSRLTTPDHQEGQP
jgi:hypothetical protein